MRKGFDLPYDRTVWWTTDGGAFRTEDEAKAWQKEHTVTNRQQADDNPPDGTAMHYERALEVLAARIRELEAEVYRLETELEDERLYQ